MIIVLLLFFQSICLYCQRLVLYVYDRWINPKNVRLLSEAAELTGNRKLLQQPIYTEAKRNRKRYTTSASGSNVSTDSCNFCANTPKGYCRHHLYLQELEIQKQQQRSWNPLSTERPSEYRQWRKANRELKRNLKNRFLSQQQQQQREQEQTQQQLRRQTRLHQEQQHTVQVTSDTIYTNETSRISISASLTSSSNSIIAGGGNVSGSDGGSTIGTFSNNSFSMYVDSAYQSNISRDTTLTLTPPTSGTPSSGVESVETIYYFEPLLPTTSSASGSSSSSLSSGVSYVGSFAAPVSISTSY